MVEYILGNYLVETKKISAAQLQTVLHKQDSVRVKLGLIAVSEGFMTTEQAEEVNEIQAIRDMRFGDIAVEKGYRFLPASILMAISWMLVVLPPSILEAKNI